MKVRLIVAGLVFGIGFYGGLVHEVLTRAYWPGVEALSGLICFLGLGILVGLWLPRFWRPGLSLPGLQEREPHPVVLARIGLAILAGILLVGVLAGSWVTNGLALAAGRLPERFLLIPFSWRLLAFILPAVVAIPVGVLFGLILDLAFCLFVYLECPHHPESDSPDVQRTTGTLIGGVLLWITVSWSLGFYLAELFPDRWRGLVLVPVICSLGVVLLSLLETGGEAAWLRQVRARVTVSARSFPEQAAPTSTWAGFVFVLLGWFAVWNSLHWSYAVSNWLGADRINPGQSFGLIVLAALAGMAGTRWGMQFAFKKANRPQSAVDRRGLAVALQGVFLVLATIAADRALKAEQILTLCPQVVLPLCLIALSGLWGATLALMLPALASGRPSRFDAWTELVSKLAAGVILAAGLYMLWQWRGVGNLVAVALAALAAIAVGGVAIIYNEATTGPSRRSARTAWRVHLLYILFLYVSLGLITALVPPLKASWLKPTSGGDILVAEGPAGVACLAGNGNRRLVWANRVVFPERLTPELRAECRTIVRTILNRTARQEGTRIRALILGAPFLTDTDTRDLPLAALRQIDVDAALRKMEMRSLQLEGPLRPADILDLNCGQRPYHTVIVMVPDPWPPDPCWPDPTFLVRRVYGLVRRPQDLWFLSITSDPSPDPPPALTAAVKNATGHPLAAHTFNSQTGEQWHVFSSAESLPNLPWQETIKPLAPTAKRPRS